MPELSNDGAHWLTVAPPGLTTSEILAAGAESLGVLTCITVRLKGVEGEWVLRWTPPEGTPDLRDLSNPHGPPAWRLEGNGRETRVTLGALSDTLKTTLQQHHGTIRVAWYVPPAGTLFEVYGARSDVRNPQHLVTVPTLGEAQCWIRTAREALRSDIRARRGGTLAWGVSLQDTVTTYPKLIPRNILMSNEQRIRIMLSIFGHRIEGEPDSDGTWLTWGAHVSTQTLAKFVGRAKDAGIPGVFCRRGVVGCLAADPEAS